jgi:hypothetical protein
MSFVFIFSMWISTEPILQFATFVGASTFDPLYRTGKPAINVAPPTYTHISNTADSFESGDNRKSRWLEATISSKFYRINKYKIFTATSTSMDNEFNVVLSWLANTATVGLICSEPVRQML